MATTIKSKVLLRKWKMKYNQNIIIVNQRTKCKAFGKEKMTTTMTKQFVDLLLVQKSKLTRNFYVEFCIEQQILSL